MLDPSASPIVIEDWEVLDLLSSLVDKSLALYEEDDSGTGRYRLLESVRDYASYKLVEAGESHDARRRHLAHFLSVAVESRPHLGGRGQQDWLERLEHEHDNLRAALIFSSDEGALDGESIQLADSLAWFWYLRGHWNEGRQWVDRAVHISAESSPDTRARTAFSAASLAHAQSDYEAAKSLYGVCLSLSRQSGDDDKIAWALGNLAAIALEEGHPLVAAKHAEESVSLFHKVGNEAGTAALLRVSGDIAMMREDYSAAHSYFSKSLALLEDRGDRAGAATLQFSLGILGLKTGDTEQARLHIREALVIARDLQLQNRLPDVLDALAELSLVRSDPKGAARLMAMAESIRDRLGAAVLPANSKEYARLLGDTRSMLTAEAFNVAWQEGRAMTLEHAIEYALGET